MKRKQLTNIAAAMIASMMLVGCNNDSPDVTQDDLYPQAVDKSGDIGSNIEKITLTRSQQETNNAN